MGHDSEDPSHRHLYVHLHHDGTSASSVRGFVVLGMGRSAGEGGSCGDRVEAADLPAVVLVPLAGLATYSKARRKVRSGTFNARFAALANRDWEK